MKVISGAMTAVSVVVLGSVAWLNSKTKQQIKLSEQREEKKMDSQIAILNAKMDTQNATLNAKMDTQNATLNAKMDSILQNLNRM
jgi:hypothetical protein